MCVNRWQGACRSVAGTFPGVPDSHFDSTPLQRFYIQLTLAFFMVDSIHVRAVTSLLCTMEHRVCCVIIELLVCRMDCPADH